MPNKLRSLFSLAVFVSFSLVLQAQQFGFEWIRPYQPYYKFKVGATGVFRIHPEALQNAGVNLNNTAPQRFQLFYLGREVPLYISGTSDGLFNGDDVIEFVGFRNTGLMDSLLYASASWQPSRFNSLFTDTAVYFLTILPDTTTITPLRYTQVNDDNFAGLQPEQYFMDTVVVAPAKEYLDGPDLANFQDKYITSEYENGEGWGGDRLTWNTPGIYGLRTPSAYSAGPSPQIEYKIIGVSNARQLNGGTAANQHHIRVDISPDNATYTNLTDLSYKGYETPVLTPAIQYPMIGNSTTYIRLSVVNDLNLASDYNSLSYIWIKYARAYNLNNQSQKLFEILHHRGGARTYVEMTNVGMSQNNAYVFDLTARTRIATQFTSGTAKFVINNTGKPHAVYLYDSTRVNEVSALETVSFPDIKPADNYEYIIVTHPVLEPAASNYTSYRSNTYHVLKVYSEQLYDYYFYGLKHALAVKRLMQHLAVTQSQKPAYLLLAGRGYQCDKIRFANPSSPDPDTNYFRNYVPALGVPAADGMFTSGLTGSVVPEIPVGRIPALTSMELQSYLDKLVYYESDSLGEWRKRAIHVSGGNDGIQQLQFANQINANANILKGEFVGATVKSFNKNTTDAQQKDLRQKILDVQNEGAALFTFLGHASLTILDVDIGDIVDLDNNQKYPFYYFNGCNVGNASELDIIGGNVSAKDFVCTPNKGAIAWLAHSNLTFDGNLFNMMNAFYTRIANTEYGSPVGDIMLNIGNTINPNDAIMRSHIIQWQLQGDPSLVVYGPNLPDYRIASNDLYTTPENLTVQEDSFAVNVIVTNLGKATADSVEIKVKHTLPGGAVTDWPGLKYKRVYYKDTFQYWLKYANPRLMLGNNFFEVSVDPSATVEEGNELNNIASFTQYIAGGGVSVLLPAKYAIVSSDSVTLIGQNNNALTEQASYVFEIDTTASFNSPGLRTSGVLQAGAIARWKVPLFIRDSLAYYWRVRLNVPINEGGQWEYSSFSGIKNGGHGFAQVAYDQVKDVSQSSLRFLDSLDATAYPSIYKVVKSVTAWGVHSGLGVQDPYFNTPSAGQCISQGGVVCVLFDGSTLRRKNDPDFPTNCNVKDNEYQYYTFDPKTTTGQAAFTQFLTDVKPGDYVAAYSFYRCGAEVWPQSLRTKLAELGLNKVSHIDDAYNAFSFIIKKGEPLQSVEDTVYDNTNKGYDLLALSEKEIEGRGISASFTSTAIGPALKWYSCAIGFDSIQPEDHYTVHVIGVREDFSDTILLTGNMVSAFNLSGIDAATYPFLKYSLITEDSINRSPVQVKYGIFNYEKPTELAIDAATRYSFYNNELEQGDSMKITLAVRNISDMPAPETRLEFSVKDENRIIKDTFSMQMPSLAADQFFIFSRQVSTRNLSGQNQLNILVNNDRAVREESYINNYMSKLFTVKEDVTSPVLDVTFDGYRILNGDFVSPSPTIRITSKDNNKYIVQNDTSTFDLLLRTPVSNDFEKVLFTNTDVTFYPASEKNNTAALEYKPENLADGDYTLKVQARDASGNLSGANEYEVDFKVVNESTITNFYPYPNPGTTNIRFVFTLTGGKAPERLLIRIMTVSGKIVKEITEQDFGPIKIGNNVSEYAWDGTDNYGDRLANGVYLYQVLTRIDGQQVKKRETAADKFVTHNTGKIYLLK